MVTEVRVMRSSAMFGVCILAASHALPARAQDGVGGGESPATERPVPAAAADFRRVPQAAPRPAPAPQDDGEQKPKESFPRHEWSSRVMTGIEHRRVRPDGAQSGEDDETTGFFLRQARIKAKVHFDPTLRANISVELADGLRPARTSRVAYLRNAYLHLRAHDLLQFRAGQFRRPYSKLELTNSGTLPFRGRGLFNSRVVVDEHWGDRALGLAISGRHRPSGLRWYLGASETAWAEPTNRRPDGLTSQLRVEYKALDGLEFGVGGGHKYVTYEDVGTLGAPDDGHMLSTGADVTFKTKRLRLAVEALAAERRVCGAGDSLTDCTFDINSRETLAVGATAYGAYVIKLARTWGLQPTAFVEYADSDREFTRTEALRMMGGANLLYGDHLRLMAQLEVVQPLGDVRPTPAMGLTLPVNSWKKSQTLYLMLSAQM